MSARVQVTHPIEYSSGTGRRVPGGPARAEGCGAAPGGPVSVADPGMDDGPRRAGPRFGGIPAPAPGDGAGRRGGRGRQVAGGGGDHGKTARALGGHLREHGHAVAVGDAMSCTFAGLRAEGVPTRRACVLAGRARATHYRHTRGPLHGPRQARAAAASGQALSAAERESVLTLINTEAYADLPVGQIWARELDAGSYLCPAPGMYRIARAAGQSRERRRQATHPAKVRPELLADGPSQVWTRDITKLRGPARGISCQLYVLIDIYSRSSPSWIISPAGDSQLATDFIAEAIERNGTA